ncbi:phage holin family protein [Isoptericola sp. NEAU-Y5]|uniref:Phage holin family protein n=1 Tax=Isoptericola luteus TaxID=2879484 RepID=A0ABS7ZA16_9MICO|nr:phage holin family protein [Isoptericola sp. NEAU-Y5]MCA5891870.1 phage holin family protein [Isoptericola sp. NEAU-Y5]
MATVPDPSAPRSGPAASVPRTGAVPSATPRAGGADPAERGLGDLVGEVTRDLSTLVRQEIELAKAEAKQSAKQAGKGAGLLAGAGYGAGLAVLFASIALWWALGDLMGLGWAALVVAVLWAVVAAVLALVGRSQVRQAPGMEGTTDSLKKIPHALQGEEEKNR